MLFTSPQGEYYHLWIAAAKDQVFFATNLDKAYFISLLQDSFSLRAVMNDSCLRREDRSHVELIAYSLTDFGLNLLVHASSVETMQQLGQHLLLRYADYLNQQRAWEVLPFDTIFAHDCLVDAHEALTISREIHLLHDEWRTEWYSSIGFYLDDRRGDWMQPWRLTRLFNNDAQWYENFLKEEALPEPQLLFLET